MQEKGDPFGPPYSSLLWSVHVLQNYFVHHTINDYYIRSGLYGYFIVAGCSFERPH